MSPIVIFTKPSTESVQTRSPSFIMRMRDVLSALDILQPPHIDFFQEMYPFVLKGMMVVVVDFNGHIANVKREGNGLEKGLVKTYSSPVASLVLTDSSQLTSDNQHLVRILIDLRVLDSIRDMAEKNAALGNLTVLPRAWLRWQAIRLSGPPGKLWSLYLQYTPDLRSVYRDGRFLLLEESLSSFGRALFEATPLAPSSASLKPILCGGDWEGESCGVTSQPSAPTRTDESRKT
uniref:Uncharacterized protein n=1 Tax=Timema monikensis TaxID=170555 RepID=A0A7R9HQM2_9NEOP|nr:unnamed protein product [Timema monikensis]